MRNGWLLFSIILTAFLAACGDTQSNRSGFSEVKEQSWSDIENSADGTTVRLYMWGGDEGINQYIDEWAAPRLKEKYGITLERVPMETAEILQKLQTEKQAGKKDGIIDIIWLNGENFKNAKENELLAGSFVDKLPNFQEYYDTDDPAFQTDFGTATEGMEAPWGKVQFVFHFDQSKIENPPSSFEELKNWVEKHPGKFTYPNAEDFTGNAFLRHVLYAKAEEPSNIYEQNLDQERTAETADETWGYLEDMKPNLWRNGQHYPNSLTELDRLYSQGEVWMTMGYNEARAESLIEEGVFPETTRSFVMEPGSIGNTHFLSIPFNSPNPEGALTAINYMLSPEAQLAKLEPDYWGENTPISMDKLSKDMREKFKSVERGKSVLSQEKLEESFLPESEAGYVEWIKDQWFNEVVQQ
ncbi:ABC transporter substrate-binding protein [Halobacillus sp. K22]|uniref:ABC transporter substrate-binding protein n=1 Tax=Halobacillus sp. K22 TaxID=3457431 RepID=UPI003FCCB471